MSTSVSEQPTGSIFKGQGYSSKVKITLTFGRLDRQVVKKRQA